MSTKVRSVFESEGRMVPLDAILPIRQLKPGDNDWGKLNAVRASIKEVGVIEPVVVYPQRGAPGKYLLLDGHLRLVVLRELGVKEVLCLVATEEDAFTYNDKTNNLSIIQEHAMVQRALTKGVTPEQIARALGSEPKTVKRGLNLLDGIHPEEVDLLKDKAITGPALRLLKKVKAIRQVDMAQLMVSGNNYTRAYVEALVVGTPADQLVDAAKPGVGKGISEEELARMKQEMETLERDYRLSQDRFGENSLHLNSIQRHVKRLCENPKIKKFLGTRYPELLEEFQDLVALEVL